MIFANLTVRDNLELGAYLRRDRAGIRADLERVFALFPRLKERMRQPAGTLSGGEQQMLAIGRGLMARPQAAAAGRALAGAGADPGQGDLRDDRRRSTDRGPRSCWSSRTRTWRCRSRTTPTCSRPDVSWPAAPRRRSPSDAAVREAYLGGA